MAHDGPIWDWEENRSRRSRKLLSCHTKVQRLTNASFGHHIFLIWLFRGSEQQVVIKQIFLGKRKDASMKEVEVLRKLHNPYVARTSACYTPYELTEKADSIHRSLSGSARRTSLHRHRLLRGAEKRFLFVICVCIPLFSSLSLSLCLSFSSFCRFVCIALSNSVSLFVSLCLYLSISLCISAHLCFLLHLSVSLCLVGVSPVCTLT